MSPYTDHVTTWTRRWARPRVTVYRPADTRPRIDWNRYGAMAGRGGVTIGIGVVLFRRAWSLTWARPVSHVEQARL